MILHRLLPRLHKWEVVYTDDDECRCGLIRLWPSSRIVTRRHLERALARYVAGKS